MAKSLFDLKGKVTVVTGGNSGIGLGFARGIAKQGGDLAIWARSRRKMLRRSRSWNPSACASRRGRWM